MMVDSGIESKSAEKQTTGLRVMWGLALLVNAYAGGCVVAEQGPVDGLRYLAEAPAEIASFLLDGFGFYMGAVLLLALVLVPVWLVRKKRPGIETWIIWSTAIHFFIIGLSGFNGG